MNFWHSRCCKPQTTKLRMLDNFAPLPKKWFCSFGYSIAQLGQNILIWGLIHSSLNPTANFQSQTTYTVLHIFRQVLFWAGNQGNHQNFDPSLLTNKLWLVFMGMKKKKSKSKWPTQKNNVFQNRQFSIFFCENFDFFFFKFQLSI